MWRSLDCGARNLSDDPKTRSSGLFRSLALPDVAILLEEHWILVDADGLWFGTGWFSIQRLGIDTVSVLYRID
jgi:hypothetical protein